MVKKHVTYCFSEFLDGNYNRSDEAHLRNLFNNMSYQEKVDILSCNFAHMWYRMYRSYPESAFVQSYSQINSKYIVKRNKFEQMFLRHDGGLRLRKLVSDSINVEPIWEVPKGRKSSNNESDIDTAIREFTEETNIDGSKYRMLWHLSPYIETFKDFDVMYQNIYYYAEAIGDWQPAIKFGNHKQINEVSAIKWCSLNDLKFLTLDGRTHRRLLTMFEKSIKKYKNYVKSSVLLV